MRHSLGQPGPRAPWLREAPAVATARTRCCGLCPGEPGVIGAGVSSFLFTVLFTTMPLYEGLGSGGEKTAVVIDLGEAFTK